MSDVHELADRFFAAIEAGDIATVREVYAPDAEIWHNTDGLVQSPDDNARTLGWIAANLRDVSYTKIKRSATEDGFVQQHVLVATNRAGDAHRGRGVHRHHGPRRPHHAARRVPRLGVRRRDHGPLTGGSATPRTTAAWTACRSPRRASAPRRAPGGWRRHRP